MLLDSTKIVMLLAMISALSRAGLNVIDRHQFAVRNVSIRIVNFWNNAVPGLVLAITSAVLDGRVFWETLFDWRVMLFAALAQVVAYAFSYAFKYLNVNQVTVAGKLSDLMIPIAIFLTTGGWNWVTFWFSVATTLVCIPILWTGGKARTGSILGVGMVLCVALVLQASLSPLLTTPFGDGNVRGALVFAAAVIVWRACWSAIPVCTARSRIRSVQLVRSIATNLFILRYVLTIVTQVTFILVVRSSESATAWPILNSTGLLAMLISSRVLKDEQLATERMIVVLLVILSVIRFAY